MKTDRILVPLDGSALAEAAIDAAFDLARGTPFKLMLLRAAEAWMPELVVLGRSASSEPSPSLGSVARLGAYHLECSVLVVDRAPESVRE